MPGAVAQTARVVLHVVGLGLEWAGVELVIGDAVEWTAEVEATRLGHPWAAPSVGFEIAAAAAAAEVAAGVRRRHMAHTQCP